VRHYEKSPFVEVLSLKAIRSDYSSILLFSVVMSLAQILLPDLVQAQSVVVGVNVYDYTVRPHPAQDVEIERLQKSGVKTIRTGLSDKSAYFITQAYKHGIGTIAILFPTNGSQAKPKRGWSDAPLSGADSDGFANWLQSMLDPLEATGVRLTAMELGNEINTSGPEIDSFNTVERISDIRLYQRDWLLSPLQRRYPFGHVPAALVCLPAALLAYEKKLFPRSASAAAEAERNLKLCFDDNAPQSLLDLFTSYRSVK
jgi:hypothetical protein